jgi:hypothetical protein
VLVIQAMQAGPGILERCNHAAFADGGRGDMKCIYIAGPYRDATVSGIRQNIANAESLAIEVWKLGAVALCPHKNSAYLDGVVPDRVFLDGGIELLRLCDAVVTVGGWQKSQGSRDEIAYAESHKIPVFHSIAELAKWINP